MNNQDRRSNGTQSIVLSAALAVCFCTCTGRAFGYGPEGHRIVGEIADQRIANTPAAAHVKSLLDNRSLKEISNWADDAKYKPDPNDAEMVAFIQANPHQDPLHDHHKYHYTDIPLQESHYREDSVGATKTDVVHMIRNCILILQKQDTADTNPTHITDRVALRLLVHYVGDVHQPLHVGAAYFDQNAQLINPNAAQNSQADNGGNSIKFRSGNLHAYWDGDAVRNAMKALHVNSEEEFAHYFLQHPPQNWEGGPLISEWAAAWATEVLPIAADAHGKLEITKFHPTTNNPQLAADAAGHTFKWAAKEKGGTSENDYDQWAAQKVSDELARSGYRLAALLQKIWPQ